jgi:hypothetical protein
MTSGEFHQLVALIQGQFMQIDRRLGEISRRLERLEHVTGAGSPAPEPSGATAGPESSAAR